MRLEVYVNGKEVNENIEDTAALLKSLDYKLLDLGGELKVEITAKIVFDNKVELK